MSCYEIGARRLNKADGVSEPVWPRRLDRDLLIEALNLGEHVEDAQQIDLANVPSPSDLGSRAG